MSSNVNRPFLMGPFTKMIESGTLKLENMNLYFKRQTPKF